MIISIEPELNKKGNLPTEKAEKGGSFNSIIKQAIPIRLFSGRIKIAFGSGFVVFCSYLNSLLKNSIPHLKKAVFLLIVIMNCHTAKSQTSELIIGTATADISPALPVALGGQMHLRIANVSDTPLTANVLAIESRNGNVSLDVAIMVSCDIIVIPQIFLQMVREEVHKEIPELDVNKIILNATHAHTAPVLENDSDFWFRYAIPKTGVLQVEAYRAFFVQRVSKAIVKAWNNRQPCKVSWGLSHAVVGYNRRAVYADGTVAMYGNTNAPNFSHIEGMEDHDVNVLFFWDKKDKLMASAINVGCPAQEAENNYAVHADYWHHVRLELKKRFGQDLCVLGWISAAGDISTRPMYRKAAEDRMVKLRNLTQLEEMGRRVAIAVEEAYAAVKNDRYANAQLIHKVEILALPIRLVTEAEYLTCKSAMDKALAQIAADPKAAEQQLAYMTWNRDIVNRYERQKSNPHPVLDSEVHVLRLGDIAICTSQFELFADYGTRIQARSNSLQTFTIQLAGQGSYLATENATKGGGYSAIIQSVMVAPEGGQLLVERTLKLINSMFSETIK